MNVSVVIPVYNEEKYISRCIESLLKQEEKPDEIICVNNNSTDKSAEIISQYPVRLVNETIQGMIPARNKGFDSAEGDIIARTDADSLLPSSWIKKIKADFNSNQIDALTGLINYYDLPPSWFYHFYLNSEVYLNIARFIQHGRETLIGPNLALTKNIWQKVRTTVCMNDKAVHEDQDLGLHILKAGGKIMRDPTMIVQVSSRRIINNPTSFFIEYHVRAAKTIIHKFLLDRSSVQF